MSDNTQKDTTPYINVTPLIDVLLVLLIIFMMISPLKPARFEAKVPIAPENDGYVQPNPYALIVSVDKKLQLKLNRQDNMGTITDMSKLSAELVKNFQFRRENGIYNENYAKAQNAEDKIEKTVFIKAPRSVSHGDIAKVIDGVKSAGAQPIALQIDDLEQ